MQDDLDGRFEQFSKVLHDLQLASFSPARARRLHRLAVPIISVQNPGIFGQRRYVNGISWLQAVVESHLEKIVRNELANEVLLPNWYLQKVELYQVLVNMCGKHCWKSSSSYILALNRFTALYAEYGHVLKLFDQYLSLPDEDPIYDRYWKVLVNSMATIDSITNKNKLHTFIQCIFDDFMTHLQNPNFKSFKEKYGIYARSVKIVHCIDPACSERMRMMFANEIISLFRTTKDPFAGLRMSRATISAVFSLLPDAESKQAFVSNFLANRAVVPQFNAVDDMLSAIWMNASFVLTDDTYKPDPDNEQNTVILWTSVCDKFKAMVLDLSDSNSRLMLYIKKWGKQRFTSKDIKYKQLVILISFLLPKKDHFIQQFLLPLVFQRIVHSSDKTSFQNCNLYILLQSLLEYPSRSTIELQKLVNDYLANSITKTIDIEGKPIIMDQIILQSKLYTAPLSQPLVTLWPSKAFEQVWENTRNELSRGSKRIQDAFAYHRMTIETPIKKEDGTYLTLTLKSSLASILYQFNNFETCTRSAIYKSLEITNNEMKAYADHQISILIRSGLLTERNGVMQFNMHYLKKQPAPSSVSL